MGLLNRLGLPHRVLSSLGSHGILSLGAELVMRNFALCKVIRRFKPHVMAAIGGTFIAHSGFLTRTPSVVFYDTENAVAQNAITYPLASCVVTPRCYEGWLPSGRHIRYDGYHELSYLRPEYFTPDKKVAISNGLAPTGDTFFIRLVSWRANHDVGEKGWPVDLLARVVRMLSDRGKVLISSEAPLPDEFAHCRYEGHVDHVHHVMAHCRALIGESATMASESAVLGVPSLFVSRIGRGYTNEQERRYGLVKNIHRLRWEPMEKGLAWILEKPAEVWKESARTLLANTIDVAAFAADFIEKFPHSRIEPVGRARDGNRVPRNETIRRCSTFRGDRESYR